MLPYCPVLGYLACRNECRNGGSFCVAFMYGSLVLVFTNLVLTINTKSHYLVQWLEAVRSQTVNRVSPTAELGKH